MNFSIILASRERVNLLTQFIQSVATTTNDITNIEVLAAIDDDDFQTHQAKEELIKAYPFTKFFSRPRSNMLNKDYLNWVYNVGGSGKYIIICNDDAIFRTSEWDQIAYNKIENYLSDKTDGVVYGFIEDKLKERNNQTYCCFPLISKIANDILGFAMPPEYPSWDADITLYKIYSSVNRICNLSEITIEHICYHSGTREKDNINCHVQWLCNIYRPAREPLVEKYANKLNEYLLFPNKSVS